MSWFGGPGEEQGRQKRVLSVGCWRGHQHKRCRPSHCPQRRPCGGQGGKSATQPPDSQSCGCPPALRPEGGSSPVCRLAFPFLTSFSSSVNGCRGGSRKPGRFLFRNQPRPWLHWHNALCPLAGNPDSSGPQLWPAATPGPRGSLPSACPHGPCDGELATWPQAPLTLTGSGASTPQGPAVGDSRNATRWLWAGDLSFCSFKWAEKPSCLPARGHCQEHTFLPALSGQARGWRSGGWGLSHFTFMVSLFSAIPHVVTDRVPQR